MQNHLLWYHIHSCQPITEQTHKQISFSRMNISPQYILFHSNNIPSSYRKKFLWPHIDLCLQCEDLVTGTFPNWVLVQIIIWFLDLSVHLPLGMYYSKFLISSSHHSLLVMHVMMWHSFTAVWGFNSHAWQIFLHILFISITFLPGLK